MTTFQVEKLRLRGVKSKSWSGWNSPSNRISLNPRTWKHAPNLPPVIVMDLLLETLPLAVRRSGKSDLFKHSFLLIGKNELERETLGPGDQLGVWTSERKWKDRILWNCWKEKQTGSEDIWDPTGSDFAFFHLGHHGNLSMIGRTDLSYRFLWLLRVPFCRSSVVINAILANILEVHPSLHPVTYTGSVPSSGTSRLKETSFKFWSTFWGRFFRVEMIHIFK